MMQEEIKARRIDLEARLRTAEALQDALTVELRLLRDECSHQNPYCAGKLIACPDCGAVYKKEGT